jgi:predicted RNA-binding Zn-ribbon protein involved in translation (DUF1610 family)
MMEQWKGMGGQAMDVIANKLRSDAKNYPSRRPCPSCGGPMIYLGSSFSALTGRYSRTCQDCGYADPHKVKMVRQI